MSNTTDPTTYHTAGQTITNDAGVILHDSNIGIDPDAPITSEMSAHDEAIRKIDPGTGETFELITQPAEEPTVD
jgi:hypothetical protein